MKKKTTLPVAKNKSADQFAHLDSLICAFAVRCFDSFLYPTYTLELRRPVTFSIRWSEIAKTSFLAT